MSCQYNGNEYSAGSLICKNGRELKCDGESWMETGYTCFMNNDESTKDSYYKISFDKQVFIKDNLTELLEEDKKLYSGCLTIIPSPNLNVVRVYNSCDSCKIAHLAWDNGIIDKVRIGAGTYSDTPIRSSLVQLVGESNC